MVNMGLLEKMKDCLSFMTFDFFFAHPSLRKTPVTFQIQTHTNWQNLNLKNNLLMKSATNTNTNVRA